MYKTDLDYFDIERGISFGDMEWTFDEYDATATDNLEEAKQNVRDGADWIASEVDDIVIFTIYEESDGKKTPVYVMANCTKSAGIKYGIKADEYLIEN